MGWGGGYGVSQAQHGSARLPTIVSNPGPLFRLNFIKELKGSCFDAERDIISKCTFLRMNGKLSKHP